MATAPWASAFEELQGELRRREALERQAKLDARQAELDALSRQVALENLASNKEQREALATQRQEETQQKKLAGFLKLYGPGSKVTPEKAAAAGVTPELLQTVEQTTLPVPGMAGASGVEDVPATPTGEKVTTFLGTPEQQMKEKQRAFMSRLASGDLDLSGLSPEQRFAVFAEAGLELPAAIAAPKTATETKAQRDAELEAIFARPKTQWTPEEVAKVEGRRGLRELEGEQAATRQQITILNQRTQQEDRQAVSARGKFMTDLNKDAQLVIGKGNAASQLINDAKAGGVNDSTLMTGFIQMKVGGYGSGLRLSDFETKLVMDTMTRVEQAVKEAKRLGIWGRPEMVSPRLRQEMIQAAQTILDKSRARLDEIESSIATANEATSEQEANNIRSVYTRNVAKLWGGADDKKVAAPGGQSAAPTAAPVKKFNPKTGKVE